MIRDPVVSGALLDFLGWATTQEKVLKIGASESVSPAFRALEKWAKLRSLDLTDADVLGWDNVELI